MEKPLPAGPTGLELATPISRVVTMSSLSQDDRDRAKAAAESNKKDREAGVPEYNVSVPPATAPAPAAAPPIAAKAPAPTVSKKVAVFVAHGMGQPIPFQTLDAVAEALRELDETECQRETDPAKRWQNQKPVSRAVKFEDQFLQRIELELKGGAAKVEAHIYEAYWAPLTEGRINARQVIGFLAGAGSNGLKNGKGRFKRWLFNKYTTFPIPIRTILFLLVALAAVGALVIMNSAIGVVSAGRAFLSKPPAWQTDALFVDLTTTFNIVVTAMLIFGIFLVIAHATRRLKLWGFVRWIRSALTLLSFIVTLFVVILAGALIVLLFYGHVRAIPGADPFWYRLVQRSVVIGFNNAFDLSAFWIMVVVAAFFTLWWAVKIIWGTVRDLKGAPAPWFTVLSAGTFLVLTAAIVGLAFRFAHIFTNGGAASVSNIRHALAWPLLVAASAYVRLVLVQFVGDVAIYVMPYKLDAFNSLRKEIKDLVYKVGRAVYTLDTQAGGAGGYAKVIVVGHSLGSVIVYDALNRLILEDEASTSKLDVVNRTPLFLTFGSPLDKTAYIFSVQGNGTTEARESVATAVQPMILGYKYRPKRWVNIYSPWDIISGSLEFYDPPIEKDANGVIIQPSSKSQRVDNKRDPDATTLLIAHTEYWADNALASEIYKELRA